ncbi:NfeD family protein [uncultured Sphingomonas sp.]|uniref:NfeD family protein n=1 Tax=uncultured Sphingomonas sp. TaxID=158754 RepID=UPI0035CC6CCF
MTVWLSSPALLWLAGALVLALAELVAPGFFLIFLATGAAVTGVVTLAVGAPLFVQVIVFAVATTGAVAMGYRWYRRSPVPSADPLLNNRAARLVGELVEVTEPIVNGVGRVRVADGVWPARGPDAVGGTRMRVVGESGGELVVEPA